MEAERLAYADRDLYLAYSDFVAVSANALIDEAYLAERAKLIDPALSMGEGQPGTLQGWDEGALAPDDGHHGFSTSHTSIVDPAGNEVQTLRGEARRLEEAPAEQMPVPAAQKA